MAYARVSYTGDGSTKIFTVPFPYIASDYVEVRVGGVLKLVTTDYTWLTTSTLQFVTAPAVGKVIYLLRNTPKQDRLVNYQDAAVLREADLDLDSDQTFHIVQEAMDAAENTQAIETFVGGVHYTAGVTTSLTLGAGDIEMTNILVLFDGAAQHQTEYSEAGGVITFDTVIPVGVLQIQVSYATPLTSGLIDGSVTTPTIADLAVTTGKLVDLSVTTGKLANLSVTTGKLADLAVTTGKLAAGVLSADATGRLKMADGFLTQAKLSTGVAGTGPAFGATETAQALTTAVTTKLTLATEQFDTASNFASSRFTPTVAGYYHFSFNARFSGATLTAAYTILYVNGAAYLRGSQYNGPSIGVFAAPGSFLVYLNGTTDYVELYGYAEGTTLSAGSSTLTGFLARAA